MNLQRYEQKVGYARLDDAVEKLGDRGLMSLIVDKLSHGIAPSEIANDLGVPFMILWEWLEADQKRRSLYDEGWRMYADTLHAETVRIADMATPEDVSVAKLRVDTRFKAASNYDKKRFGQQQQTAGGGFSGGVTIVIGEVKPPERLVGGGGMAERVVSDGTLGTVTVTPVVEDAAYSRIAAEDV